MKEKLKMTIPIAAFKNVIYHKNNSFVLIALFMLLTATDFLNSLLTESMSEGLQRTKKQIGADVIVVPESYVSAVSNALFMGKPCTVNFSSDWIAKIKALPGVKNVSAQLFIASLGAECCDNQIQLVAFDPQTDFSITPWLSLKQISNFSDSDIIVGHDMNVKPGEQVSYFGRKFTVRCVLDASGTGYDDTAFITLGASHEIASDPRYAGQLPFKGGDTISAVLIQKNDNATVSEIRTEVEDTYAGSKIRAYIPDELLSKYADSIDGFKIYGTLLKTIFILFAYIALVSLYTVYGNSRLRELGSMDANGVSREKICIMLAEESCMTATAGSIAGIIIVFCLFVPFSMQFKLLLHVPYVVPDFADFAAMTGTSAAVSLALSATAELPVLIRAARLDSYDCMKENC